MNLLPRWLILTLLVGAAVACYVIGFAPGFGLFIVLGVLFEIGFWLNLFRKKSK